MTRNVTRLALVLAVSLFVIFFTKLSSNAARTDTALKATEPKPTLSIATTTTRAPDSRTEDPLPDEAASTEPPPPVITEPLNEKSHPFFRPFNWTEFSTAICPRGVNKLIVVHTANHNQIRRAGARDTFANETWHKKFNYRTLFAVGRSSDPQEETALHAEARTYKDIVCADYFDAYRNMTIKFLMWMRYVRDYCPDVKYIVKIDDDIMPNIFWTMLDIELGKVNHTRTFTCLHFSGPVFRDLNSPWYVPEKAHRSPNWEPYCSGPALIMSADMIPELIRQAEQHEHYVSVDDAFITGTIAAEIKANHDFELYKSNFQWNDKRFETDMLARTHVFGAFKTTSQERRVFDELAHMYGFVTDPPDHLKGFYKGGPKTSE